MLDYKIKLKTERQIAKLCYETEDGKLGEDGIAYNSALIAEHNFRESIVVGVLPYGEAGDEQYGFLLQNFAGAKLVVHLDWIGKVEGIPIDMQHKFSDVEVQVNYKYMINTTTGELVNIDELHKCNTCGGITTLKLDEDTIMCKTCQEELTTNNGYSYRPKYNFLGTQIPADKDTPVWYGLEVEVSTDRGELAKFMYKHKKSVFLKSDSSICGRGYQTEIVSHPHSFSELMKKGSWLEGMSNVPAEERKENGCHIHISRSAFKDDKHYSLFYFLMHKMEDVSTIVGGRALTDYCQLLPSGKIHSKKNGSTSGRGRSLYLNEQNSDTIEARFFKGTNKTANLKAYVQYLESIIKYTGYHSKAVSTNGWFAYMTKKPKKYEELITVLAGVSVERSSVTFREPIRTTVTLRALNILRLKDVVAITTKEGRIYDKVEVKYAHFSDRGIKIKYIDEEEYSGTTFVKFNTIKSIVVES